MCIYSRKYDKRLDICFYWHGILFSYWPVVLNSYDPQWRTQGFYMGLYGFRIWKHKGQQ